MRARKVIEFGEMHSKARYEAGKSREFVALELGVSPKTIQNWESGLSSPTFFQSLEYFEALGLSPFPYYLNYLYPSEFNLSTESTQVSDEEIEEAFRKMMEVIPLTDKRALLYTFYGSHGSNPHAVIQMMLAHLHTPLKDRVAQATIITQMYEMEKELDNLICKGNILPDMEALNNAVRLGKTSAQSKKYGYID